MQASCFFTIRHHDSRELNTFFRISDILLTNISPQNIFRQTKACNEVHVELSSAFQGMSIITRYIASPDTIDSLLSARFLLPTVGVQHSIVLAVSGSRLLFNS